MKIANCKYCGTQAKMCTDSNGTHIYCPDCLQDDEYTADVLDCVQQDAIDTWNDMNTDQHGQQIKRQIIDWVEWDGDVEHLPKEGSDVHVLLNPSIVSGWIKLVTKENKVSAFIANNGLRGDIDLRKGDMFAVVEN